LKIKFNIVYALICFISIFANDFAMHCSDLENRIVECEVPGENNSEKESKEKNEAEEEDEFLHGYFYADQTILGLVGLDLLRDESFKESHIGEIPSPPPDLG